MSDKEAQTRAALLALWERNAPKVLESVQSLEQCIVSLLDNPHGGGRSEAYRTAHKLAGSLGTYGLSGGTDLAREIEYLLEGLRPLETATVMRLSALVISLRDQLDQGRLQTSASTASPAPAAPSTLVTVASSDDDLVESLSVHLQSRGLEVRAVEDLQLLSRSLYEQRPDVLVLDVSDAMSAAKVTQLMSVLDKELPVVVLMGKRDQQERVQLSRLGADFCLKPPFTAEQVAEGVQLLLTRGQARRGKVLTVDDDPNITEALELMLKMHGYEVDVLNDPNEFWPKLEQTAPDILLLDIDMPGKTGIDLCREVRSDPRWLRLPILFLTARRDADTIEQGFSVGADDYLTKPIIGSEVARRVQNRLERAMTYRTMAETDTLTGAASRQQATQRFANFIQMAGRQGQPFTVALLNLDRFQRINNTHGYGAADLVLRRLASLLSRTFRGYDLVSRWGGGEFLVGMYGLARDEGVGLLEEVLESLRSETFSGADGARFKVTASAGLAQFPQDGEDLRSLVRSAEKALEEARSHGGDGIEPKLLAETR